MYLPVAMKRSVIASLSPGDIQFRKNVLRRSISGVTSSSILSNNSGQRKIAEIRVSAEQSHAWSVMRAQINGDSVILATIPK